MNHQAAVRDWFVAVSTSETPDLETLGFSDQHLRDATAELARHLLASGARLAYAGDLRKGGFADLLLELVVRYCIDSVDESGAPITNFLPWPSHMSSSFGSIEARRASLTGGATINPLAKNGTLMSRRSHQRMRRRAPRASDWTVGLTAMRVRVTSETDVRIVLGGRVKAFKGVLPGVAEEALTSLRAKKPLFVIGGFGGCARDIAETLGLVAPSLVSPRAWPCREAFGQYHTADLRNGLDGVENAVLARTPHIDEAIALVLRGLVRLENTMSTRDPTL